jgi:ketosteroid isomerase-like protein
MGTVTTPARQSVIDGFDKARSSFLDRLEAAPDQSLAYLKPGDDYALGGLVYHVNAVLEHYLGVLDAMVSAGFKETEARDRPGLFEEANARAKAGLDRTELSVAVAATERLHGAVTAAVAPLPEDDFERKVPVRLEPGADPYPTSANDVLGWLTGHYEEHVPHIESLLEAWTASAATPSSSVEAGSLAAIEAFNDAFSRHDVDGIMAHMTDDCVFENTLPPPDGERYSGSAAVRAFWESFFTSTPSARFETEELVAAGDRAFARWVFRWDGAEGEGHVRGVDIFRVRDGKVAEKLSYVKG